MQPRRSCPSRCSSVTKAPRRSPTPGTPGNPGGGRPLSAASMALRANASSAARSVAVSSGSSMVLLSAPDGVRTIELLVHDNAGELMGQCQRSQTPGAFGLAQKIRWKPVSAADHERDIATFHLPASHQLGELLRGPRLAAVRQRDDARILRDARRCHFPFLDFGVVADPAQVLVTGRPERRALHAAASQGDDAIAHQAYMPRNRCIPATRSTATM